MICMLVVTKRCNTINESEQTSQWRQVLSRPLTLGIVILVSNDKESLQRHPRYTRKIRWEQVALNRAEHLLARMQLRRVLAHNSSFLPWKQLALIFVTKTYWLQFRRGDKVFLVWMHNMKLRAPRAEGQDRVSMIILPVTQTAVHNNLEFEAPHIFSTSCSHLTSLKGKFNVHYLKAG